MLITINITQTTSRKDKRGAQPSRIPTYEHNPNQHQRLGESQLLQQTTSP